VVIFPRSEKWRGSAAYESYRIDHEEWVNFIICSVFFLQLSMLMKFSPLFGLHQITTDMYALNP
jgi:hypothetical protein